MPCVVGGRKPVHATGRWASTFGTLVGMRIARDELMLVAASHFHRTVATHKWCDMCSLEL